MTSMLNSARTLPVDGGPSWSELVDRPLSDVQCQGRSLTVYRSCENMALEISSEAWQHYVAVDIGRAEGS